MKMISNGLGWKPLRFSNLRWFKSKPTAEGFRVQRTADRVLLEVQSGSGGNGCNSFNRTRSGQVNRTTGGGGGDGGSVRIVASTSYSSLTFPQRKYKAANGLVGGSNNKHGRNGKSITLFVPVGTLVHVIDSESVKQARAKVWRSNRMKMGPSWADGLKVAPLEENGDIDLNSGEKEDSDWMDLFTGKNRSNTAVINEDDHYVQEEELEDGAGSESLEKQKEDEGLETVEFFQSEEEADGDFMWREDNSPAVLRSIKSYDLTEHNQEILIAVGGKGGIGNQTTKSWKKKGPTVLQPMQLGESGESKHILLETKSIADVGLVGYPNAGKSSILRMLSRARPKVASYAFTTLSPHLGTVEVGDIAMSRFVVADIPGLIDGAHRNAGLGHEFLRHVERTKVLAFVLDVASTEKRCPVGDLVRLRRELTLYKPELAERPWIVLANKVDHEADNLNPTIAMNMARLQRYLPSSVELIRCSADRGRGVAQIIERLYGLAQGSHKAQTR